MKNIKVPTPLISIAILGSKPISNGARTVEPNIATTCCIPSAMVCGQGRRSSGATTMLSAGSLKVQLNMVSLCRCELVANSYEAVATPGLSMISFSCVMPDQFRLQLRGDHLQGRAPIVRRLALNAILAAPFAQRTTQELEPYCPFAVGRDRVPMR